MSTASQKLIFWALILTTVCVTNGFRIARQYIQRRAVDHRGNHLQIFECDRKTSVLFSADKAHPGIRLKSGLTTVLTTDRPGACGNSGQKTPREQMPRSRNAVKTCKAHKSTSPRQFGWVGGTAYLTFTPSLHLAKQTLSTSRF